MTTPNFENVLDRPMESIEAPKPIPVGTYMAQVTGQPRFDKSKNKGTDFVEFTLSLMTPGPDVDQDQLQEMGGVTGKTVRSTYYLTDDSIYRLKDFLVHCGIEGVSLREGISSAPGRTVNVTIKHTPSQDGQKLYSEIARTSAV